MRFRNWWLHVLFWLNTFDQTTAFYGVLGAHFGLLSLLVIFIYSNIFILYCYSLCELSMYRVEIPAKNGPSLHRMIEVSYHRKFCQRYKNIIKNYCLQPIRICSHFSVVRMLFLKLLCIVYAKKNVDRTFFRIYDHLNFTLCEKPWKMLFFCLSFNHL